MLVCKWRRGADSRTGSMGGSIPRRSWAAAETSPPVPHRPSEECGAAGDHAQSAIRSSVQ
eukprot:2195154-Prymnesium_polylepis.1